MNDKNTIFLTGGTGLVGSYLLKVLLQNNYKVYVLARNTDNKSAKDRVVEIQKFWDKDVLTNHFNDIIVIEGDITKENLGLDVETIKGLNNEVREIFHCAAVTQFNWPLDKIRKVNIEGTKNVLELGKQWGNNGNLKKVNYISTAYIYGDYNRTFKENDLDLGQKFSNTYEQTKFEAENLANEYRNEDLWIDVFRPALIVGVSDTGKTFQFKHIYQLIRICTLEIFNSLPLLGIGFNLVPIDFLTEAMFLISKKNDQKNQTYHIFPSETISMEIIMNVASKIKKFTPPKLLLREDFNKNELTFVQKSILEDTVSSVDFTTKLDSNWTMSVLKEYGLDESKIDKKIFVNVIKYFLKIIYR